MEYKDTKILIVDEEEILVTTTEKVLKYEGFITFTALNGRGALEIFKKEHPHLTIINVFLDYQMDGIELFQQIKAIDPEAKCLVMTYSSLHETITQVQEAGIKEYMSKPFGPEALLDKVKEVLGLT